jgi:hypothetical protein
VRRDPLGDPPRIGGVAYDPVSRKLPASAPVAHRELLDAFARFEHLTLTELQDAFDATEARFRAWVEDPANAGRPLREAPDYLDRIALDSLLERRTWME